MPVPEDQPGPRRPTRPRRPAPNAERPIPHSTQNGRPGIPSWTVASACSPERAATYQPRAERRGAKPRSAALGDDGPESSSPERARQCFRNRDVIHSAVVTSSGHPHCFALSGLWTWGDPRTQGGAALCPGLICSGPFGANKGARHREHDRIRSLMKKPGCDRSRDRIKPAGTVTHPPAGYNDYIA